MKLRTMRTIAITLFLLLSSAVVCGQRPADDASIDQLKGTVSKLEGLIDDANIPPDTRQQLNEAPIRETR